MRSACARREQAEDLQRARAVSAHRRGVRDPPLRADLDRLHTEARRVGFHLAAGALARALRG